jgi:protein-glutamine gamma-glutamyltransferase
MIRIRNKTVDTMPTVEGFSPNALQKSIFDTMAKSAYTYRYDSEEQLAFELTLRNATVEAARALAHSGLQFRVFRKSFANPQYWRRTGDGGFLLLGSAVPDDAIADIFNHGALYGTECATAMIIVYYGAMLRVYPDTLFNRLFSSITLMDWQHIDRDLAIQDFSSAADLLPGDAKYFANPDVNPLTPEWQGENVFYLGGGLYYGHGIGIADADTILNALNSARRPRATHSAYLMNSVKRQNYSYLYSVLNRYQGNR